MSHLIQHKAATHSKALWHIHSEHPQTQAFFRPLSFSLSLTLKFSPHGEGFALSRGICIYDENNCLSKMRCFFWEKKMDSFFFFKKSMSLKITYPYLPPSPPPPFPLLWRSSFRFSPMVFLYLSTVIPSIWFLELSLLQSKLPINNSSGPELHLLAGIPITAVRVPKQICPPRFTLHAVTLKQNLISDRI